MSLYQEEGTRHMRLVAKWGPQIMRVFLPVAIYVAFRVIGFYMNYFKGVKRYHGHEMTIAEILSNEELRHHEFPVAGQKVSFSPMPLSAPCPGSSV